MEDGSRVEGSVRIMALEDAAPPLRKPFPAERVPWVVYWSFAISAEDVDDCVCLSTCLLE